MLNVGRIEVRQPVSKMTGFVHSFFVLMRDLDIVFPEENSIEDNAPQAPEVNVFEVTSKLEAEIDALAEQKAKLIAAIQSHNEEKARFLYWLIL